MRLPAKKIIVLLIQWLSCRKVNVIPAPDKATHRDLALFLGALKPADKTALAPEEGGGGIPKKDKSEKRKKGE